jgi:hypothetical protein
MSLVRTKSISHPLARDTHAEDRGEEVGSDPPVHNFNKRRCMQNLSSTSGQCELVARYFFTNINTRLLWNLTKKKRSKEVEQ